MAAEHHHDAAGGVHFDRDVGAVVDSPDVAVGVDANAVGVSEEVGPERAGEIAVFDEDENRRFEAGEDVDVAVGVGIDRGGGAEVHAGGEVGPGGVDLVGKGGLG